MKEKFDNWNPTPALAERVEQCEDIINEYTAQGLKLTLRQLYYQFVSRALIPNTERSYKNLGTLVSKARVDGILDWDAIEDRGRQPDIPGEYRDLEHIVKVALGAYRLDRWAGQDSYAELWVEKAALALVAANPGLTMNAARGKIYMSRPDIRAAAQNASEANT